jgi:Na+/phosphate symporter
LTLERFGPDASITALAQSSMASVAAVIGPAGVSSDIIEIEAAELIVAGQAVRPNPQGKLVLARADSAVNAKQVAIARVTSNIGFPCEISNSFITLTDWSVATGSSQLVSGSEYFLSSTVAGRLTILPPLLSGNVVLCIGTAINTQTLALVGGTPILQ